MRGEKWVLMGFFRRERIFWNEGSDICITVPIENDRTAHCKDGLHSTGTFFLFF